MFLKIGTREASVHLESLSYNKKSIIVLLICEIKRSSVLQFCTYIYLDWLVLIEQLDFVYYVWIHVPWKHLNMEKVGIKWCQIHNNNQ